MARITFKNPNDEVVEESVISPAPILEVKPEKAPYSFKALFMLSVGMNIALTALYFYK
jgi:hypothetical protein